MALEISYEEAFPTVEKRCSQLFEENLQLRVQVDVLERRLTAAQAETERIQQASSKPDPQLAGPDLAAQPPFPKAVRG